MDQRILIIMMVTSGEIILLFYGIKALVRIYVKKQYHIRKMPLRVKVKLSRNRGYNSYELSYPYWAYSKKDGTADLRRKSNSIIWRKSTLHLDGFALISKRPYDIISLAEQLRLRGVDIELCKEEKIKYSQLLKEKQAFSDKSDIQRLVDYYAEEPTEFETLCADLYECLGYAARLTPATNDGGYDILLTKNGRKTIVECKCYSVGHNIGRPTIQKLVGANSIVNAEKMLFITTSDFSAGAVEYAREVGMELVNGARLMDMLEQEGFLTRNATGVDVSEYQLRISDLYPYIPKDIYFRYFARRQ